jgi:murein DD-endopeptidase MepM/ murein hydrolase activator NlpD
VYRSFIEDGVFEVQLPQAEQRGAIQACVDILSDSSAQYPAVNVPWRAAGSPAPQFTYLPVSVAQLCTGQLNYEIHGFGYGTGTVYPRPGFHMGVDFFAPIGSNIYSIANNGIIAGIAIYDSIDKRNENSVYKWGGAENFDGKGYAVIVRHKDLYVLYGHLQNIDPSIYVGRKVSAGAKLGTLGRFNTPHLHIEIRSFGANLKSDTLINQNVYGILEFDGEQPENVYDITQFFNASNVMAWNSEAQTSTSTVSGLGFSIQNNGTVSVSGCQSFKYLLETTSTSASGYRGFKLNQSLIAPHDPVTPSIPPAGAPVE